MPQALHAIGVDPVSEDAPPVDDTQRAKGRTLIFDRLCARHGMPAAKLAEMPTDDVAKLLKEEGQTMIDPKFLPDYVAEYLKAKNG